ncbi:MAG: hypothetical protein LBC02_07095 [Planctomycetaceae bacterium]|jgi:hypothetical protein|nr:hypothetical protein [Planctomycetaceae bacterium]
MKILGYLLVIVGLSSVLTVLSGCRNGIPSDIPPLQPVELTFTQNGDPLPDAIVTLYSEELDFKWSIGGGTDANGHVLLMTNGRYAGVPKGTYKITVDRVIRKGPPIPEESELPKEEEQRQKVFAEIDKQTQYIRIVENQFLDSKKTPLEIEIVQGKNSKIFDLGKPVRTVLPNN